MNNSKPGFKPLTVLVGTCNRIEHLQRCLDALREYPRDFLEIVVSDAGSTDGSRIYLEAQKDLRVIFETEKRGQAKALNEAAGQVQTEFLCWISDDNVVRPHILTDAVHCLQGDHRLGMLGLKVKDRTGPYSTLPFIGGVSETGVLNCNQGIIRRQVFESVGGFDEDLRDYMIDNDLTTKVLLGGWEIALTRKIAIEHYRDHEATSWITSASRQERMSKNQKIYFERYAALSRLALDILLKNIGEKERLRKWEIVKLALNPWRRDAESACQAIRAYHLFLRAAFVDKSEVNSPGSFYCLRQALPKQGAMSLARQIPASEQNRDISALVTRINKSLFRAYCAEFDVLSVLYNHDRSWAKAFVKYRLLRFLHSRNKRPDRLLHAIRGLGGLDEIEAHQVVKDIHTQKKCRQLLDSYLSEYAGLASAS